MYVWEYRVTGHFVTHQWWHGVGPWPAWEDLPVRSMYVVQSVRSTPYSSPTPFTAFHSDIETIANEGTDAIVISSELGGVARQKYSSPYVVEF